MISTCLVLLFLVIHIQAKLEPSFTSSEGVHDVLEDRSLQLPCQVQNLGEDDYAVMWKKVEGEEERILFVDNEPMSNDQRFRLDYEQGVRFDLNLNRVERYDSGVYQCEITTTPSKIQKHIVNVRVPPTVNLAPDRDPYMVKPGESIELTCYASGNPMPSISWRREGQPLPDHRLYSEGAQLRYDNVNASYDGIYECTANNEVGGEAKAKIKVQVHSPNGKPDYGPWVKASVKYIPVASGANVNVTCKYDGNPEPNVNWFLNSHPVDFKNDRFKRLVRRDHNFTEVTLAIHGIEESDYGDYTCRIANNLGTVEESIHVSGQPGPPEVTVTSYDTESVSISWKLRSKNTVTRFKVRYRTTTADSWKSKTITAHESDRKSDNLWESSTKIEDLSPGTEYQIQVQGYNSMGWGSYPKRYTTQKTEKSAAVDKPPPPTKGSTRKPNDNQSGSSRPNSSSLKRFSVLCFVLPLLLSIWWILDRS